MPIKTALDEMLDDVTWFKCPRYLPAIIGVHETIVLMTLYRWWDWDRKNKKTGWAYRTALELNDETGLSVKQQQIARRNLRSRGLVREHHHRQIHRLYFTINEVPFSEVLHEAAEMRKRSEKKPFITLPNTVEKQMEASPPETEAAASGRVVAAPAPFDMEENTEENKKQKPSPKPSSGGRGLSFSSSSICSIPGALPSPNDKDFPKTHRGNPDWLAAIEKYDTRGFAQFGMLFPKSTFAAGDPTLARSYWKARQGLLNDRHLEMFVHYYRETRHDDPQPSTWKVSDYYSFLRPRHLQKALPLVRSYLQEKIRDNRYQISQTCLPEVAINEVAWMHDRFTKGGLTALKEFLATNNQGVAAVLAYARAVPSLSSALKLEEIDGEALRWDLGHNSAWIIWCRNHKLSTKQVFGLSDEEIIELNKKVTNEWENENREISRMIGQPYAPIDLLADAETITDAA